MTTDQPPRGETGAAGKPAAPAGWYPDPADSGRLLYWDGSRWTGDVHEPGAGAAAGEKSDRATIAVIAGGAAFAISPFLPWVKVILLGDLSLFQLFEAADRSAVLAWGAVIAGAAAAVTGYLAENVGTIRRAGLVVGALGGILALYALVALRADVKDANGLAAVAIGPYIAVAGCVAMVIGALKAQRPRKRPAATSRS